MMSIVQKITAHFVGARINARRGQGEDVVIISDRTEGDDDGDRREG
jgi:hypothetical protein